MSWTLKINGMLQTLEPSPELSTLSDLLEHLQIEQTAAVAEVDGQIVLRQDFDKTPLRDGQSIELIRFVGGG